MKSYWLPAAWEQALDAWRGDLRLQSMSEATIRLRADHVRAIARLTQAPGPRELTGPDLVKVCAGKSWSAEHRKAMRASLQSFYRYCIEHQFASEDVSLALPRVRPALPCPRPATDDIWESLLASAPPRERLMARLAGEAGMRRAEVARAHRDDLMSDGGGWALIVHGKGGKQRTVPITASLADEVQRRCQELMSHASWNGYLFPGHESGHVSVPYVGQLISALMPPGWSMHKLRHRFATRGYAGTGNLRAVQEALGHASVATTQRYTAVSSREVRSVSEAAAWHPLPSSDDSGPVPPGSGVAS